jgi:quercetin dioxygenase-like cupin family protein
MSEGQFVIAAETEPEVLDWGRLKWMSHPPKTGADQLTVIDVTLSPGKGHNFHKHPDQEEVIYVTGGRVEQWLGLEKRILTAGDSAFIPAGLVHASFNAGAEDAHVVAILGPCIGQNGYVSVEVASEAPWKDLR